MNQHIDRTTNVFRLPIKHRVTYRYKPGDIGSALAEGLRHEVIAGDIEQALHDLLFVCESEDVLAAREMLSQLLNALEQSK